MTKYTDRWFQVNKDEDVTLYNEYSNNRLICCVETPEKEKYDLKVVRESYHEKFDFEDMIARCISAK